jgi:hypothetical protein
LLLSVNQDKTFLEVNQYRLSFLAAITEAGHSLVGAAKRAHPKVIVSAIVIVAFCFVPPAVASIVTMTVTGQVFTGTDYTGVFGFAPNTGLSGQNFTLVFTFDDTKGKQSVQNLLGMPCGSSIANSGLSNPGKAVLKIGTGSWTFGTLQGDVQLSMAERVLSNCAPPNEISALVLDEPNGGGSASDDAVTFSVEVLPGTIQAANYSWEDAFSASQFASTGGSFSITVLGPPPEEANVDLAGGTLAPTSITVSGQQGSTGLQFVPVTPCRVADTRNAAGPFGGPELAESTSREFDVPQSSCSIPSSAVAYSLNVTAVPKGPLGYLTLWPSGQPQPTVSTLNSDGRVKANAAVVPAGTNGGVNVFVTDPTQVILDIDGYFVPAGTSSALAFYPLTPCRVVDTRNASGSLGGPTLAAATSRSFPLPSGNCGIPSDASAYSLNVTAVPKGALGYLTMWPSGQAQPLVSTLNAPTGAVTANAAIVPAGNSGQVSVYVTSPSDVILDVNGYFAAPSANGLSLYTTTPCRVLDTRNGSGVFNGVLSVAVESSTCAPSSAAQAYVLNATVVPPSSLGYLTLWPAGETQPVVSTLNAEDGSVTSNMAIVPTNNGSVSAFSSSPTQLILDISSYFAP